MAKAFDPVINSGEALSQRCGYLFVGHVLVPE